MRCKKHKRYKAKLRPRCNCLDCWKMYIESHLNLDVLNDAIDYQENMYGGSSFEYGSNDDNIVINYLREKKKELDFESKKI